MTVDLLRDRVHFPDTEIEIADMGWAGELTKTIRMFNPKSNYSGRGQKDRTKIKEDAWLGKATEWGCAEWLQRDHEFPWLEPDFTVYPAWLKNYQADLPYSQSNPNLPDVCVKSVGRESMDNYQFHTGRTGYSWVFGETEESHPNPDDLCVFMYADNYMSSKQRVIATAPWKLIKGLLEAPYRDTVENKAVICSDRLEALLA